MHDLISRQAAIDALMEILDKPNHADFLYTDEICKTLNDLPSAQPEITLESAIDYLHSIGWMQEHDRILSSAQPEPLKITIDHAPTPDELERLKQAMRNTPIMLFPSAQPERCEDCENFSKTRLLIPQPDIIRCRDCKYGEQDYDGWWYCRDTGYSMGDGEKGDGFCSYAERKTDDDRNG